MIDFPQDPPVPRVDELRCTNCGDCVTVCPTECMELWIVPVVARTMECIACSICEEICPEQAIAIAEVDNAV